MVESYVRHCEELNLAPDTVRLRLVPVKMAWRRMHADYPELVKPPVVSWLRTAPPVEEIECLEADEAATLLGWLKTYKPSLWPMGCLQALAGLQMLEAASLRWQDVDLNAGTICIADTGRHKPKNHSSYRTIPVCAEVVEALRLVIEGQKVRPVSGELFVDEKGNPWSKDGLSQRWTCTLRAAAKAETTIERKNGRQMTLPRPGLGIPRLASIPARKLRAAFATMAGRLGVQDRILRRYMGHSAGDILGGHYRRIDLSELRTVSDAMNDWREVKNSESPMSKSGIIEENAAANG